MKKSTLLLTALLSSFLILSSSTCNSSDKKEEDSKSTVNEVDAKSLLDKAEINSVFGQLFTGAPYQQDGEAGCTGTYNGNWNSYFSYSDTSINMTAGNDCRTVDTKTNNSCVFNIGDNAITQISFDFEISDPCHNSADTDWLAFWIYSEPWNNKVEVDFIESKNGPGTGLNSNFAGVGHQVVIYPGGTTPTWKGSITADFSGTGNAVAVRVSNSVNNQVATSTLARSTDYFFVMDTTPTTNAGCTITVSNVTAKGSVPSGQCIGLTII